MASARSPGVGERGLQQVRDDLGVGLRGHARPRARRAPRRSSAKFSMMPLWMTATRPPAGHVRVGVDVGRAAVGGPAGVPDPGGGGRHRVGGQQRLAGSRACRPSCARRGAPSADDGDPGGVVPAVLQALQARHDDVHGLPMTDVPHDSAHGPKGSRRATARRPGRASGQRDLPGHGARPAPRPRSRASASVGASTMTRTSGSVPLGRSRTRPVSPSRACGRGPRQRQAGCAADGRAVHVADVDQHLGQLGHRRRPAPTGACAVSAIRASRCRAVSVAVAGGARSRAARRARSARRRACSRSRASPRARSGRPRRSRPR